MAAPAPLSGTSAAEHRLTSSRVWRNAVIYIAAAAMFLRFYDLPLKPLHHDEGVNTLLLTELVQAPHTYQYDPTNYHGPTLFYLGWLSVSLFGMTTVAVRAVTASAGLLTVLLFAALRKELGTAGALAAAVLLAVSPGAVYFSRYFIHETLLICFTVAAVVSAIMWWNGGPAVYLYLASASTGLMFATKETAIITAVVLLMAAAGAFVVCDVSEAYRDNLEGSLIGCVSAAVSRRSRAVRLQLGRTGGVASIVAALGVFLVVNIVFYTSLFRHWQGLVDAVRTLAFWTKTGTTQHTHAWYAYLEWLWAEELPLVVPGAAGIVSALWLRENRFAVFAALWTIGMLVAYSLIPYKTPWLTLNIIVPLAIAGGYSFDLLWRQTHVLPRTVHIGVAIAIVGFGAYQAAVLNFAQYDNEQYPYVYAHTSRDVFRLLAEIERFEASNPGASIAVTSRDQFPLSWYLRAYPAGYYGRATVTNDPLVVASEAQQATLGASLGERYERIGSYRLRPGVRLVLYARRDLRRPQPRTSAPPA